MIAAAGARASCREVTARTAIAETVKAVPAAMANVEQYLRGEAMIAAAGAREALRKIQVGLQSLGHVPGPVDGLWGPSTRGAVQQRLLAAEGRPAPAPMPIHSTSRLIRQGKAGHPVREIIVHCSATRPTWMQGRSFSDQDAEIRRWHVEDNRWSDIGYHWVIGRCGERAAGRAETAVGAHIANRNAGTIGICLIGGHGSNITDDCRHHFTEAQERALVELITEIGRRTAISEVSRHNQYAAKACPSFHVPFWWAAHRGT